MPADPLAPDLPPPPLGDSEDVLGRLAGWLARRAELLSALAVFALTALAAWAMMPPSSYPELAYVFAAPAVFWAYRAPRWRSYLAATLGGQMLAWSFILGWLHHVTWTGPLLLGPFVGLWVGLWFIAVRWTMPRLIGRPWPHRVLAVLALAAAWVLLEWTRTWVLTGFPWLPLSATQWLRLSVLQPAAYAGAWAVSFTLIAVNVSFAAYAHKLLGGQGERARTRCPEFIAAMVLLLGCLLLTIRETFNRNRHHAHWATIGVVQPAIPQTQKWDNAAAPEILRVLEAETLKAAALRPDLLLWPEATTPLAVLGDPGMAAWTTELVRRAERPLLLGTLAYEAQPQAPELSYNAALVVTPWDGVSPEFYAKRHLVPFGEYVPLRPVLGWLEKFVPVGGDFSPGAAAALLHVPVGPEASAGPGLLFGPLICYEDIFPNLARASVRAGAEALVVNTNNGWFGEGAAAYQHAAHSVLRAVETRRPVLRVGNAGWSGWIDECGAVRAVLTREPGPNGRLSTAPGERAERARGEGGTIYFRGGAVLAVSRDTRFLGVETLYVRWGDWFVAASALLATLGWLRLRRPYVPPPPRPAPGRFRLD